MIKKLHSTKFLISVVLMFSINFGSLYAQQTVSNETDKQNEVDKILKQYNNSLHLIENRGQWDENDLFRASKYNSTIQIRKNGFMLSLLDVTALEKYHDYSELYEKAQANNKPIEDKKFKIDQHAWMIEFMGMNQNAKIQTSKADLAYYNYIYGSDQTKWVSNVHSFGEVIYKEAYTNTDIRLYASKESDLEYDIILKPGSNPANIVFNYQGLDGISVNSKGELVNKTMFGDLKYSKPYAYQFIDGKEIEIPCRYKIDQQNNLSFELGNYNHDAILIIDPVALRWAAYLNGNSNATATTGTHNHGIEVDISENIYVGGRTDATNFPLTTGRFQPTYSGGTVDGFITKLVGGASINSAGSMLWTTYLGGNGADNIYALKLDASNNIYVTGNTSSTNYPTAGSTIIQSTLNGTSQSFVTKMNTNGTALVYSTYIGNTASNLQSKFLYVNSSNEVFVVGQTTTGLTTTGTPLQAAFGGGTNDGFLLKINAAGTAITYSTYYGGAGEDELTCVRASGTSDIIVVGTTTSTTNIATAGAFQTVKAGTGIVGFVAKFTAPSTVTRAWGTYINSSGGTNTLNLTSTQVDASGNVFIGGFTTGAAATCITTGSFQTIYRGNTDLYVGKLAGNGATLIAGTYVGGTGTEVNMMGINISDLGDVYALGYTNSPDMDTTFDAVQPTNFGGNDAVFFKISSDLTSMKYLTYWGGTNEEFDPIGYDGIKFSTCKIYTALTVASQNAPMTRNSFIAQKLSATTVSEAAVAVWGNPPIVFNDSISGNSFSCNNVPPVSGIVGEASTYALSDISRNLVITSHPNVGALTYVWQKSTDLISWTLLPGVTTQNLSIAQIGPLTKTTYFRRLISNDYCPSGSILYVTKTVSTLVTDSISIIPTLFTWCSGSGDSAILNTVNKGGTPPYSYSWTASPAGANLLSNNISNPIAKPSVGGTYTYIVTITDSMGCSANDTVTLTVISGPSSTPSVTGGGSYCSGGIGVPIGLNTSQVGIKYQLIINGALFAVPRITGTGGAISFGNQLVAGIYKILATDTVTNCTQVMSDSAIIIVNPNPTANAGTALTIFNCPSDSVRLGSTPTASGGTAPYAYKWSPSNGISPLSDTSAANPYVKGITSNTIYTVTVTDVNTCTASSQITVNVTNSTLRDSINASGPTTWCSGSGGSVTLTALVSGGTAPFTYSWTGTSISPTNTSVVIANPSSPGSYNYVLTVIDAKGCSFSSNITITVNAKPDSTYSVTGGGSYCSGGVGLPIGLSNTQVGVNYQLILNGITNIGSPIAGTGSAISFGLKTTAGTYTIRATNTTTGCDVIMNSNTTISILANPIANAGFDSILVACSSDSVQIGGSPSATGGKAPYTYRWNPFTGLSPISDTVAPNPFVKGIGSTTNYTLIVTDSNGCSDSDTMQVSVIAPNLSVSLSIVDSSWCTGTLGSSDTITANVTGGASPYSYTWSGTALLSSNSGQKVNALDNVPGNYTAIVNVIDATGCLATSSIGIEVYSLPTSHSIIGGGSYCFGGTGRTISINSSDTGVNYQLVLNDTLDTGAPIVGTGGIISFGLQTTAGTYKVRATRTATACSSIMTGTATIIINNNPTANAGNDTTILNCPLDSIRIGVSLGSTATGGLAPYTYNWSPSTGLVSTNVANPTVTNISANTTYKVIVTDANGCVDSNEVFVSLTTSTLATSISAGGSTSWCALSGNSVTLTANTTGGIIPYNYSWIGSSISPTNTAVVVANPQVSGTYNDTVLVVDRAGCSTKAPITITVFNTATVFTVGGGGAFCSGGTGVQVSLSGSELGVTYTLVRDGILTSTVLAGTGSALIFPNQTLAGNYTVQARINLSGCVTNMSGFAIVSIRPLPIVNAGQDQVIYTCPNDSVFIGSLPTASGLNPPFTYSWSPSTGLSSTSTSNPYVKGITSNTTYTVVVNDTFGCISADSVVISTQSSTLDATIVPFGPTTWCAYSGGSTLLFASPTGGTPPYTYQWSGSNLTSTTATTTTANPNLPGTYTYRLTITDSKGCSDTSSLVITVNNIPDTSIRILGGGSYCVGSIGVPVSLSSSELNTSYQLFYNGGFLGLPIAGTGGPISFGLQILTGVYSVRATSSLACAVFLNNIVTVVSNPNPHADAGPDQVLVSCNSDSVRLGGSPAASGSTGPYTYYWTPNAGMRPSYDSTANPYISRIGSRIVYNLLVTDANGCSNSDSVLIEIVPPTLGVSITTSGTPSWCEGINDSVQYTANITGGTAPYSYHWSGVNISPTNSQVVNASPDTAGVYSYPLVVTDANGCQVATSSSITVFPLPDTSFIVLGGGSYCSGGVAPSITLSNSEVGTSYQLVLNSGINIGAPIVSIGGAISFGSQPAAGTYTIIATSPNSCSAKMRGSAVITIRPNPIVDAGNDQTIFNCPSDSVRIGGTPAASGGTAPYIYSWTPTTSIVPTTSIANPYIKDLDTTTLYTLTVTDINGCIASDNVLINIIPSNLSATISPSGVNRWCEYSGGNVTLTGIVTGGRAPYTYTWSGATPTLNPAQVTVNPQTRGTYTYSLSITDAAGCTFNTSYNVIVDPAPDSFNVTGGGAYCQGGLGVLISLDSSLVGTSYQLVYNFGTNVGPPVAGTGSAISFGLQTIAGIYTVNATTSNGCIRKMHGTATVTINPKPIADAGIDRVMVSCSSDSIQVGGFPAASSGTPPYTYQWSPSTAFRSSTNVANPYIGNLGSDTYYNLVVTDQNGCIASDTMLIRIVPSTLSVNISPTNVAWCEGTASSSNLTALVVGGTAPFTYIWSGSNLAPLNTQITTANPNIAGTYYYTIIVTDVHGCQASKTDSIRVNTGTKASITSTDTLHCTTDPAYPLTAVPSGGTFTGIGVIANVFYPSLSGAGTRIINYRYINANGCISDTSITFTIITTTPAIITGAPTSICSNASAIVLTGIPAGGTFSGAGMSGNTFDPSIAGVGTHTITYIPLVSSTCYSNATVTITVNPSPSLSILAADDSICRGASVVITPTLSLDVFNVAWYNLGGSFIRNDVNPITVSPTGVDNGYEAIAINTPYLCRVRDTVFVHLNQRPIALDDTSSTCEEITITNINVSNNDSDPENDLNTYTIIRGPRGGVAVNNFNGTFNYVPNTNFYGSDTVIYSICNAQCPNDCDTALWTISICSINDKPSVPDTTITTPQDSIVTVCIPISDVDSIDLHNVSICGGPIHGTIISGPTVSNLTIPHTICLTYRPNTTYRGTDSICLITCDNGSPALCDTSVVRIIITPVNSAPVATPVPVVVNRGSSTGINISPAASDPNGDPLTYTYIGSPSQGTWTPTGNGTGIYSSNSGSPLGLVDSFRYVVCDNSVYPVNVLCDTSWVYITVIDTTVVGPNHAPYAGNDFATTTPTVSVWLNTLANDGDPDSDPTVLSVIRSTSAHGTWVSNPDGSTTYIPLPGSMTMPGIYYDTLYYSLCDVTTLLPNPLCDTAMQLVTITDTMQNRAPVATDDIRTIPQNTSVTIAVRSNDSDPDGDSLSIPTILTVASHGTTVLNPDGTVTYTPNTNYYGLDSIRYVICDVPRRVPGPLCDTAWVYITISPVNLPPVATPVPVVVNRGSSTGINISPAASDPNGDPLTYTYIGSPSQGTWTPTGNGTGIYSSNSGSPLGLVDSFRYVVCDNSVYPVNVLCDTSWVYITVIDTTVVGPNHAPYAGNDFATTTPTVSVWLNTLANDGDPDSDPTVLSVIRSTSAHGTWVSNPDGSTTYIPLPGSMTMPGIYYDTLYYSLCDVTTLLPNPLCDTAMQLVTITDTMQNRAPVATDDIRTIPQNTSVTIAVRSNDSDPDGDSLSIPTILTVASHGTTTINPDGTVSYIPTTNYFGSDSFSYIVCDVPRRVPGPLCDTAWVYITISPVNLPPVATPVPVVVNRGSSTGINISPAASDPNGDPLTYTYIGSPSQGTWTPTGNGTGIYSSNPGSPLGLVDSFRYVVCDNSVYPVNVLCDTSWVYITVIDTTVVGPNHAPYAGNDFATTTPTVSVWLNTLANDGDPDSDPTVLSVIRSTSVHGTWVSNPDGSTTYIPLPGSMTMPGIYYDTLYYSLCDVTTLLPNPLCDTAMQLVTITDTMQNRAPVATDDIRTIPQNTSVTIAVRSNDSDPDGDSLSIPTILTVASHGTTVLNPDGTVTYTPNTNYYGLDSIRYVICDVPRRVPGPLCDTAWVYITISPVNLPPVATPVPVVVNRGSSTGINISPAASDPNGDPLTYTYIGSPSQGTWTPTGNGTGIYSSNSGSPLGLVDSFRYVVCDNSVYPVNVLCDTSWVYITVIDTTVVGPNHAPYAGNDFATTTPTVSVWLNTLANDGDPDSDPTVLSVIRSTSAHGTWVSNPDGSTTYIPLPGSMTMPGIYYDTLYYSLCDVTTLLPNPLCDTAMQLVTITDTMQNRAPVATDDIRTIPQNTSVTIAVRSNDSDPDGDSLSIPTILTVASHGTTVLNPDGTVTYTPNTNYYGLDSIRYVICDVPRRVPGPLCDTAWVYITISPVNLPPVATPVPVVVNRGSSTGINISPAASDPNGDPLTYTYIGSPSQGTWTPTGNGTGIYSSNPGSPLGLVDSFRYVVCDNSVYPVNVLCDTSWVYITVIDTTVVGPNHAPYAGNDFATTTPTVSVWLNTLANDGDPDSDPTVLSVIRSTSVHGTWVSNPDGSTTYIPLPGSMTMPGIYYDTLYYSLCDVTTLLPNPLCDTAMQLVTITDTMQNRAPVATDDIRTIPQNTSVTIAVRSNDSDPDGDSLSIPTILTVASHGTTVLNPDGTVTYTPNTNYYGLDSIRYVICDVPRRVPGPLCDTAWVYITISPVNLPPVATPVPVVVNRGSSTGINISPAASDPNGDPLTYTYIGSPSQGTWTPTGNGTGIYSSNPGSPLGLVDSFRYVVCDNSVYPVNVLCDTSWVYITVIDTTVVGPNHAPYAGNDFATTTPTVSVWLNTLANDGDPDSDPTVLSVIRSTSAHGTWVSNPDGSTTYIPLPGSMTMPGIYYDTLYYSLCDVTTLLPNPLCDTAMQLVTITDTMQNRAPVATDDIRTIPQNTSVTIAVRSNDSDPDGDSLSIPTILTVASHGTTVLNPDGTVTYTPNTNYYGLDSIRYVICDVPRRVPGPLCDTAWVYITISPVNLPPVATPVPVVVNRGSSTGINISPAASDPNGDPLTYTYIGSPSQGTWTPTGNGTGIYSSNPGSPLGLVDSFRYVVCDNSVYPVNVLCDTSWVYITVIDTTVVGPNHAPYAGNDFATTTPTVSVWLNTLANDGDPDSDPTVLSVIRSTSAHGTWVSNPDGSTTYIPLPGSMTMPGIYYDTLYYSLCDVTTLLPNPLCDTAMQLVTITDTMQNRAPVATDDIRTIPQNTSVTIAVRSNDSDPDGDSLSIPTILTVASHGTTVLNPDGTVTYTPNTNYYGLDSIRYVICDVPRRVPGPLCDTAWVYITISPVNLPPVATPVPVVVNRGSSTGINISPAASDPNGDPLTYTYIGSPSQGTWTPTGNGTGIYSSNPGSPLGLVDSFRYVVCDNSVYPVNVLCDTSWVYITVIDTTVVGPNHAPYAGNDFATTTPTVSVWLNTLANDGDPDSDPTVLSVIRSTSAHGTWVSNPDGSTTYIPLPGSMTMPGIYYDTLYYSLCDVTTLLPNPLCDTAMQLVTITDTMQNRAPVATDDIRTIPQNTSVTIAVRSNDSDPDGDSLSIPTILTVASHGTTVLNPDGTVTYTPNTNYYGLDSIRYVICDVPRRVPGPLCDTAWVYITISPVNLPPVATPVPVVVNRGSSTGINISPAASDPNGDPLTYTYIGSPSQGTWTPTGNGTGIYSSNPGSPLGLVDSFRYVVCDNSVYPVNVLCDTSWVYITVIDTTVVGPNHAPYAGNDFATTTPTVSVWLNTLANDGDPDSDPTVLSVIRSTSAHGTWVSNPDGSTTYIPLPGSMTMPGIYYDTLYYSLCDVTTLLPNPLCDTAMQLVTITDTMQNRAPVATDDFRSTERNTPITIAVRSNDSDPDGDSLSIPTILTVASHGTTVLNPDGTVTYTPSTNYVGVDSFSYVICDVPRRVPGPLCDTAWVYLNVYLGRYNDPPIANSIDITTSIGTPIGVAVASYTTDPNGDPMNYSYPLTLPTRGLWVVTGRGTGTYTPYLGTPTGTNIDSFQYVVCDSSIYPVNVLCDTAWIYISLIDSTIDTNNRPIAANDYATTTPTVSAWFNTLVNDNDPDGDSIEVSVLVTTTHYGTWVLNPDGSTTYIPIPGSMTMPGTYFDTLYYSICDVTTALPNPLCDTAMQIVTITDTMFNRRPDAPDDYRTTSLNTPLVSIDVRMNDYDPDGDSLSIPSILTTPVHGTTILNPDGTITYLPDTGYVGRDSFRYSICDIPRRVPGPLCDTAWVFINITVDLIATNDSLITGINNSICYDVRINDTGYGTLHICGIPLPVPTSGSVSYSDTSICYSPNVGFVGVDSFRYVLCDSFGNTDTATVYVNVITCTPPQANPDAYRLHVGDSSVLHIIINDSLYGNPINSISFITLPLHGSVLLDGDSIKYVSTDTICGRDYFIYTFKTLCGMDTAIVTIDIYGCCPAPIAVNDSIRANGFICGTTFNPVTNDTISSPVAVTIIRHGVWGRDSLFGNIITYTPDGLGARNQTDTLYYEISSLCGYDTGIIVITIPNYECNDHHPTVVLDYLTTCKDTCSTINVLLNDYDLDLDSIRINLVINGNHGIATQVGDSFVSYCPNLGYVGLDTVFYQIIDNGTPNLVNDGLFGMVIIRVDTCSNHPPIIHNGIDTLYYVVYDTSVLDTCIEVYDADSNSVSGTIIQYPVGDTMYFTSDSCFRYVPSIPGTYTAVIVMCDGFGGCDTVYMIITVLPTHGTNVIAVDDYVVVGINKPMQIDILTNDTIPSGGIDTSVTINSAPINGTVVLNPDGSVTYTPQQGYLGVDSFEYILCITYTDTTLCDTAWVYINVIFDSLYIPNGFSPNGDGNNDVFEIPGIENYPEAILKIYSRWGDEVWDSNLPYINKKWDGTNDQSSPVPDGTYFYLLDLKDGSKPIASFVVLHRGG